MLIISGHLHDCMPYRHEESYQNYLNIQKQKELEIEQAKQREAQRQQLIRQKKLEQEQQLNAIMRAEGAVITDTNTNSAAADTTTNDNAGAEGGNVGNETEPAKLLTQYERDTRAGLTIEDVLR